MERFDYFLRRLLLVIPTFLGITLVCFTLVQFIPGGPVEQLMLQMRGTGLSETGAQAGPASSISKDYRQQLERHFGFDQPFYKQYFKWLITDRMGMRM